MKILILMAVLLNTTLAWADAPACTVDGSWNLANITCSSGAPALGDFLIGRDRYEVTFHGDSYSSITDIGRCSSWSQGSYSVKDGFLVMTVHRAGSNCGPVQGGRFTYAISHITDDGFNLSMGPVNGGTCPPGDYIQHNYEKIR